MNAEKLMKHTENYRLVEQIKIIQNAYGTRSD